MKRKLCSRCGETLTETLAAIIVVALSSLVMVSMVIFSERINRMAASTGQSFHDAVTLAEQRTTAIGEIEVRVGGYSYTAELYGTDGGLRSYALKEDGEP